MDVSVNCASEIADGLRPRIDSHKVLASLPLGKRDEAVYGTTVAILPKEWEWQPCRLPGSQQAFRVGLVPQEHTGWSPHGSSLIDRKSTRLNSSHLGNLVCRLLLEKKRGRTPPRLAALIASFPQVRPSPPRAAPRVPASAHARAESRVPRRG